MRKTASSYRLIFGYLGLFIAFVGGTTLLPLLVGFAFPDELARDWYCFVIPGVGALLLGIGLFMLIARRAKAQLGKHQDSILLVLIWLTAILISAVPFLIKGDLNFTDSIFEITSAYATVGLSVFPSELLATSHLFVFYRSILCFLGGIGLVLIITSAISDRYGLKIYLAEGHTDKLMPNLAKSARLMLSIYSGFMVLGFGLYMLAGMNWFDAFVHSISAVATAGFSSRPGGLMFFASEPNFVAIQLISVLLMILGTTNFLLALFLLTGKFKKVFKDCEVKFFAVLCLVFIPLFFLCAYFGGSGLKVGESFSQSAFTFISAITTTGFANTSNLKTLGEGVILLVVIANIIGGGMGSTSGGVKQYRFVIALKSFFWTVRENFSSPNKIYPHYVHRFGSDKEVTKSEIENSYGYILIYVTTLFVGAMLMTLFNKSVGTSFGDSLFEFSNALACTGLSLNMAYTVGTKWTLIAGMFAGRLEIIVIYFAFFRGFKDLLRKETI